MTFAHAWWLLTGGIAALAIIALHRFRPQRRSVRVSSLYLWRDVAREVASNRRRKRLLTSLLLLLQVLGVLALAFALARPERAAPVRGFELAVVVDTSASMGLVEAGGTRALLALRRIERWLSEGEADRYSLWSSRDGALLYEGASKAALLDALRRLPPPAGTSDWDVTLSRVSSAHAGGSRLVTLIATDGALPAEALSGLAALGRDVQVIRVGTPHGNVGITGFSARPVGEDPFLHEVLIVVSNFSGEPRRTPLVITSDRPSPRVEGEREESVLHETELVVEPQSSQRFVFTHRFLAGEALFARLGITDFFDADNRAALVATPRSTLRVLFVGGAGYLLRQGFAAFPQVEMFESMAVPASSAGFDLAIFYDQPLPAEFTGNALVLTSGRNLSATGVRPEISWWNRAHPLSRFVEWDQVNLGAAAPLDASPGESVLVETTLGPVVTVREEAERRVVRVAIPIERSDFPFRVAFPVFLQNLIEWIRPESAALVPPAERPGILPAAAAAALQRSGKLQVHRLDSPDRLIEVDRPGETQLSALLATPGVFAWRADGASGLFATSLLDREESDLTPRLGEWVAQGSVRLVPVGPDQRIADFERAYALPGVTGRSAAEDLNTLEATAIFFAMVVLVVEGIVYMRAHGPAAPPGRAPVLSSAATTASRRWFARSKGGTGS